MIPGAEVIFLYTTQDADGNPAYAFLSMPMERAQAFADANEKGGMMDLGALGVTMLCSGPGHEPSEEHIDYMRREHGYDWHQVRALDEKMDALIAGGKPERN